MFITPNYINIFYKVSYVDCLKAMIVLLRWSIEIAKNSSNFIYLGSGDSGYRVILHTLLTKIKKT